MITYMTRWLLAGLLSLSLWSAMAFSQEDRWQGFMDSAVKAFVDGDYVEAGRWFDAAVKRADTFDPQDPRLATSLNGLAEVYRAQERYTEAVPLYKRALAIREKALRPHPPDIVQSLSNLARAYRDQGNTNGVNF